MFECRAGWSAAARARRKGEPIVDGFVEILTFLPRLFLFFITYPLRFLGFDFDWGIR